MMHHRSVSLTEGSLPVNILRFSIPLMLSNVLQVLFNMSDIAVVGRFSGPEALGAVGSTTILVTLFTGFLIGMGSGVNVMVAHFLGAQRPKDVSETAAITKIESLSDEESVEEIARLIGGAEITENTLKSAAEMKEMCRQYKKNAL